MEVESKEQTNKKKRKRQDVADRKKNKKNITNPVVKMCLSKFVKHNLNIIKYIQHEVQLEHNIALLLCRLMNAYLVDLLNDPHRQNIQQQGLLNIDQNAVKQSMCCVSTSTRDSANIPKRMISLYQNLFLPHIPKQLATYIIVSRDGMSKTNLQYLAQELFTNYKTSHTVNFEKRTKAWIRIQLYPTNNTRTTQETNKLVWMLYQVCTRQKSWEQVKPEKQILMLPFKTIIIDHCLARFPKNFNVHDLKNSNMPILLQWSFEVLRTIEIFNEQLNQTTNFSNINAKPFKTFSLFPIVGWALGHITFDKLKLETMSKNLLNHTRWQELFKWKTKYNKNKFVYLKTDGVSVCLVFEKLKSSKTETLKEEHEPQEHMTNYSAIYKHSIGIDTGRRNFFVAAIRKNYSNQEVPSKLHRDETIKVSNATWRHMRGTKHQTKQVATWISKRPDIAKIQSEMPTLCTSCSNRVKFHIEYFLKHFVPMVMYYTSQRFTRNKMNSYIKGQQAWREVFQMFEKAVGGKIEVEKTLVVIGNPTFQHNSKGNAPTPVTSLYRKFKEQTNFQVAEIDEFNTSKKCSRCLDQVEPWDRGKGILRGPKLPHRALSHYEAPWNDKGILRSHKRQHRQDQRWNSEPWGIRVCSNKLCRTHWCRDNNSGRNMLYIYEYCAKNNGERPNAFSRSVMESEDFIGETRRNVRKKHKKD